jgi:DNA-binding response OmpR family regulator
MTTKIIKVLLIEDNAGDARLLREALHHVVGVTFTVVHAENLADGLLRARTQAFDVMMLDLFLPDSQGVDTVSRALAGAPHIPIIVLTGSDDEDLGVEVVRRGAQDFLVKGEVDHWAVTRAIRYAAVRKQLQNQTQADLELDYKQRTLQFLALDRN